MGALSRGGLPATLAPGSGGLFGGLLSNPWFYAALSAVGFLVTFLL